MSGFFILILLFTFQATGQLTYIRLLGYKGTFRIKAIVKKDATIKDARKPSLGTKNTTNWPIIQASLIMN